MDLLKTAIFEEMRRCLPEAYGQLSNIEANSMFFNQNSGLRLTYTGFIALKNIFTVYSFEIPITLKSKHQMAMSSLSYPYFLTKKRLILFSEMDSMVITLYGGIELFLENIYIVNKVADHEK